MPILDTQTATSTSTAANSGSSRRRRRSVLGEDIPVTRPSPSGMEYPSDRSSRSSGSSRSQEASSRRASRHHSRPRRHRASRSSADGHGSSDSSSTTTKPRRSRAEMAQTKANVPCQDSELFDFFKDTKIEMMRIVEADLMLKLDVREMKERFYNLVKNFEAFEQRNIEMDVKAVTGQNTEHKPLYKRHRPTERRTRKNPYSRRELSSMVSSIASSMADPSSLMSQHCPNNTKASPERENWASLLGSNDTAELPSEAYSRVGGLSQIAEAGVEDISSITRCSNVTYREQVSQSHIIDVPGPLSSTMSYPQYSTPEKKLRISRIEEVDSDRKEKCSKKLMMDEPRPKPTGMDNRQVRSKVIYANTDSDATPIVVHKSRPVSGRVPLVSEDSGLYHGGAVTSTGDDATTPNPSSQDYFMSGSDNYSSNQATPVARRHEVDSDSSDSKLRRQTAQPNLSDEHRSPVGLSETDLMDPSSFFDHTMADVHCSINATRASVANLSSLSNNLSGLSVSPTRSDGSDPPSSDVTSSTGVESSYKESDATSSSSLASRPHGNITKQNRSTKRHHSRHPLPVRVTNTPRRALSQCTSATSTSSYGGMMAPSNSPNMTSESATNKIYLTAKSVEFMEIENIGLGSRPPCVGSDTGRLHFLPRVPNRAVSDPESTVSCMGTARVSRRSTPDSGASSSDKSHSSLDSSKENKAGAQLEVPRTPKKNVRRSFSRKIMNLGKLLRGTQNKNKSSEEQHSV